MFRSVTKTIRATTERDTGERTVRYAHLQADGSVGVSELAFIVFVLLSRRRCSRRSLGRTRTINTISTSPLYAFRLPLMFRSFTKTTRATTERDNEDPTVRCTHPAS